MAPNFQRAIKNDIPVCQNVFEHKKNTFYQEKQKNRKPDQHKRSRKSSHAHNNKRNEAIYQSIRDICAQQGVASRELFECCE
jgi:hypothetical protein